MGEQSREQIRLDLAGLRPAPAFVERRSEMTLSPGIEQQVARAAIEAAPDAAALLASELGRDDVWANAQVKTFTALANGYLMPA